MARRRPLEWWRPIAAHRASETPASVPFWTFMAFTAVMLLSPQNVWPGLAPLRPALLAATVAIVAHLVVRFLRGEPLLAFTPEVWIMAAIVAWATITIPLSRWPGGSLLFLLDSYLKTLAIFLLLINIVTTLTRLRQVVWALSLTAIPLAASAVHQYLSGNFMAGGSLKRISGYDAPFTANPNDLALMLNLILPLSVALLFATRSTLLRIVLLATIFLSVVAVISTFSRGGFLTLATIVLMCLCKRHPSPAKGWTWVVLVLLLAAIPLLPSGYT